MDEEHTKKNAMYEYTTWLEEMTWDVSIQGQQARDKLSVDAQRSWHCHRTWFN